MREDEAGRFEREQWEREFQERELVLKEHGQATLEADLQAAQPRTSGAVSVLAVLRYHRRGEIALEDPGWTEMAKGE